MCTFSDLLSAKSLEFWTAEAVCGIHLLMFE